MSHIIINDLCTKKPYYSGKPPYNEQPNPQIEDSLYTASNICIWTTGTSLQRTTSRPPYRGRPLNLPTEDDFSTEDNLPQRTAILRSHV